jgi:hypothetical protein
VLHSQEQHSTPAQHMAGEAEEVDHAEEAHVEQDTLEEHEAPEEKDGSTTEDDGDEEGAPQGGDQQPQ